MREQIGHFIAGQVSSHRKSARLSQADLAAQVGISRQAVAQIESGQLPAIQHLYNLAIAFEVEVWDLRPTIKQARAK
jgi:transcriptional regulator with XRE-family HTH domain